MFVGFCKVNQAVGILLPWNCEDDMDKWKLHHLDYGGFMQAHAGASVKMWCRHDTWLAAKHAM
jgi:hypothetical protein